MTSDSVPHLSRSPICAFRRSGGLLARHPSISAAVRCAASHAPHRCRRRRPLLQPLATHRDNDPHAVACTDVAAHAAPQFRRRARWRRATPRRRSQPVRARRRRAYFSMSKRRCPCPCCSHAITPPLIQQPTRLLLGPERPERRDLARRYLAAHMPKRWRAQRRTSSVHRLEYVERYPWLCSLR